MKSDLHVAMTKEAALAIGWRGDVNMLARSAVCPDTVPVIKVESLGSHLLGHNFASFTHFCRPISDADGTVFRGYNYKRDRSLPGLDLPDKTVSSNYVGWGDLLFLSQKEKDPLNVLLEGMKARGDSMALDEMTFPTAATMAEWFEGCTGRLGYPAFDAAAGCTVHFLQDCAVPHHAMGLLADGHQAFEGDLSERFGELHAAGTVGEILKLAADEMGPRFKMGCRQICEFTARDAEISMFRLALCRSVWQPGWRALIDRCIERGLRATVAGLMRLQTLAKAG